MRYFKIMKLTPYILKITGDFNIFFKKIILHSAAAMKICINERCCQGDSYFLS